MKINDMANTNNPNLAQNFESKIQDMISNNPQMKNFLSMIRNNGNPKKMFYDMCQQRGINPDDILNLIKGNNQ